jgi:serine/threonine protein kinase
MMEGDRMDREWIDRQLNNDSHLNPIDLQSHKPNNYMKTDMNTATHTDLTNNLANNLDSSNPDSETYFAMKKVQIFDMNSESRKEFLNEVRLLHSLPSHPNLITYYECYIYQNEFYLILECAQYDIDIFIKKQKTLGYYLTEAQIWHLFIQVTNALNIMHQYRIMHRDIKPANVFLMKNQDQNQQNYRENQMENQMETKNLTSQYTNNLTNNLTNNPTNHFISDHTSYDRSSLSTPSSKSNAYDRSSLSTPTSYEHPSLSRTQSNYDSSLSLSPHIFPDFTVKLGDLGLGRFMSTSTNETFSLVGTPFYLSPELIQNIGYSFKSDIWSLGCLLYEITTLRTPFVNNNGSNTTNNSTNNTNNTNNSNNEKNIYHLSMKIMKGELNPIPSHFSKTLQNLIKLCINPNPDMRPNSEKLLKIAKKAYESMFETGAVVDDIIDQVMSEDTM